MKFHQTTPTAYLNRLAKRSLLKKGKTTLVIGLNQTPGKLLCGTFVSRRGKMTLGAKRWRLSLQLRDQSTVELNESTELAWVKMVTEHEVESLRRAIIAILHELGYLTEGSSIGNNRVRFTLAMSNGYPSGVQNAFELFFQVPSRIFQL